MANVQTITKSVTITPGESFVLPPGATVTLITGELDNSCNFPLPTPETLIEYEFEFSVNNDNQDDHPMGSEVDIESFLISGVVVPLNFTFFNTDDGVGNCSGVHVWSLEIPANNSLIIGYPVRFVSMACTAFNPKSDLVTVTIEMPESFLSKVFLKIRNDKFPNGVYIIGS